MEKSPKNICDLRCHVSESEKETIKKYAEKCGLSVSDFLRLRALGYYPNCVNIYVLQSISKRLFQLTNNTHLEWEVRKLIRDIDDFLISPVKEVTRHSYNKNTSNKN